jgi:hypothetical protein
MVREGTPIFSEEKVSIENCLGGSSRGNKVMVNPANSFLVSKEREEILVGRS